MDLLQGVQDMEDNIVMSQGEGGDSQMPNMEDMKMPSIEELLKALDGMTGMSDEEKDQLREQLMNPAGFGQNTHNTGFQSYSQFIFLIFLLFVVAFIFVFFGYKLYKSLTDKERKRDEKRKMKQMKKKK